MAAPARISLATLGVRDVERSTAFYQALGWELSSASQRGEVSFFKTAGALLCIFGVEDLAKDANVAAEPAAGFRAASLAINVGSPEEVDAALAAAVEAGGSLVKAGEKVFWGGYSGYFTDLDGHLWEVAHNPYWPLGADGLPHIP